MYSHEFDILIKVLAVFNLSLEKLIINKKVEVNVTQWSNILNDDAMPPSPIRIWRMTILKLLFGCQDNGVNLHPLSKLILSA